jgi:bromodomain adjacent to zinc finger domain protein 2A
LVVQAEKEKVKIKQEKLKEKMKREKKEKVKMKEEVVKAKPACKAEKTLATQRRLEERQRQQVILEEMKKPTEDMCLADHQVVRGK